jgi:signal transduction histidine kinase
VTHEFRTPLTGISGALLTLRRRRHRLDELKIDEVLDAALLHADRLRRLLENMLTAAEATAVDPAIVSDVAVMTREIVDGLPPRQRERLALDVPESLPAHIGREALHQVLANLIDNGLTHSWPGTTVQLSCGRVGGDAVLRVRNAGADLLPERIAHLLEPFTQADGSVTRTREGAGIGLYVVRRLVEVHGGQLTLTSGEGSITVEVNIRASVVPDSPGSLVANPLVNRVHVPRAALDAGIGHEN